MANPTERSGVDRFLRPYVTDVALWPVTFCLVVILVMFGAVALLLAVRGGNHAAMAALVLLGVMSVDALWRDLRRRRLGVLAGLIAAFWGLSGLVAYLAVHLGAF